MTYNNRILVVDDDPAVLSIFESVLQIKNTQQQNSKLSALTDLINDITSTGHQTPNVVKREFQVDTAQQGEDAYHMVKTALQEGRPYSVLFTDMRMPPGWDGVKTARKIRKIDAEIEIIIVTAYSDAPVSEIVKQVGFTDRLLYLKKPFDDEEVLQLADSLSMRWNLENKVKGMVGILENMIDSFFKLKTVFYSTDEIESFLRDMLTHIGEFLDTPDVFMVRIDNNEIILKIGLGCFSNGISENDEFKTMLNELTSEVSLSKVLRIDNYIFMPINVRKCQDVIVGLMCEREIEGVDKLLDVLARDMSRVFETVIIVSDLRAEIKDKNARIKALESQVKSLQMNNKASQ